MLNYKASVILIKLVLQLNCCVKKSAFDSPAEKRWMAVACMPLFLVDVKDHEI
jgi:hypothetical protein